VKGRLRVVVASMLIRLFLLCEGRARAGDFDGTIGGWYGYQIVLSDLASLGPSPEIAGQAHGAWPERRTRAARRAAKVATRPHGKAGPTVVLRAKATDWRAPAFRSDREEPFRTRAIAPR